MGVVGNLSGALALGAGIGTGYEGLKWLGRLNRHVTRLPRPCLRCAFAQIPTVSSNCRTFQPCFKTRREASPTLALRRAAA